MVEAMHLIHFSAPSDATKRFVRFYAHRESNLASSVLIHPVPARAEQALDFEFADPIQIHRFSDGVIRSAESAALIGLQTHRRIEQLIRGRVESFCIFLQPAALSLLFDFPAVSITNADHDARGVIGRSVSDLRERLGNCRSFHERVRVAEEFLVRLGSRVSPADSVELAAREILRQRGVCRIEALARDTGLGSRTFQRRFKQTIGLSPKTYARIVRFQSALHAKAMSPKLTWTDIAYEYGYHDQMHMVHDFQGFSTETPSGLLRHLSNLYQADLTIAEKAQGLVVL
jgi:AraC-like DNA-binding protein